MKLIVGLGNPGEKYSFTRHNVGFLFADMLVDKWGSSFNFESKFNAEVAKCEFDSEKVFVIKPHTYMNLSGNSVRAIGNFFKISLSDILVVYDDIALNLGVLRFRPTGSDGGHNGIKSIISNVGSSKFDRLKIGIGPQPSFMSSEAFVLQNFSKDQTGELNLVLGKAVEAVEFYLDNNMPKVQNKYN